MVVIVVIAILAAISIVAYTNVQNRAHDAAVQNDLRQTGTLLETRIAMDGQIPHLMYASDADDERSREQNLDKWSELSISKGSYFTEAPLNFLICKTQNGARFALVSWRRSGSSFVYQDGSVSSSDQAPGQDLSDTARICEDLGFLAGAASGLPAQERRWGSGWLYENRQWRL